MDFIINELVADLIIELGISDTNDIRMLTLKVKNACYEVRSTRNYPDKYTEDMIGKDMLRMRSTIHDLALYDYNMIGAEGQTSHSENGISRTYADRKSILSNVLPFVRIV